MSAADLLAREGQVHRRVVAQVRAVPTQVKANKGPLPLKANGRRSRPVVRGLLEVEMRSQASAAPEAISNIRTLIVLHWYQAFIFTDLNAPCRHLKR